MDLHCFRDPDPHGSALFRDTDPQLTGSDSWIKIRIKVKSWFRIRIKVEIEEHGGSK
jgi:hypothetical protein